jgi:hypothetical protein
LDLVIDGAHNNIDRLGEVCLDWLQFSHTKIHKLKQDDAIFQDKTRGVDLLKKIGGVKTADLLRNRIIVTVGEVSVPVMSLEHLYASKKFIFEGKDLADIDELEKIVRHSME